MTVYLGELETRHYTFRAVSVKDRKEVERSLAAGIREHARSAMVSPEPLLKMLYGGDWNLRILETGLAYRDSWPLLPGGPTVVVPPKRERGYRQHCSVCGRSKSKHTYNGHDFMPKQKEVRVV